MSGITDNSKFNSRSSYFIPVNPNPDAPTDIIDGNLTITGNVAVGGTFSATGVSTLADTNVVDLLRVRNTALTRSTDINS